MNLSQWDPTMTPKYGGVAPYQAPGFAGGAQGAAQTQAMMKALGVTRPQDTRGTERQAVMGQIAAGQHQANVMSDNAALARGTGAYRSGGQQANLARIGAGAGQQRAEAEMGLQNNYLNRQQAFDLNAMQNALAQQGAANTFNTNNAQFGYNAGVSNYDKRFAQNELAPWQAKQDILGAGIKGLGQGIGAGIGFMGI